MDVGVGDGHNDLFALRDAFPAGGQHDQLGSAEVDGELDIAAQAFRKDHPAAHSRPVGVLANHANVAGPQAYPHPVAASAPCIRGYRDVDRAIAELDPTVIDDAVEYVDLRLTKGARHESI